MKRRTLGAVTILGLVLVLAAPAGAGEGAITDRVGPIEGIPILVSQEPLTFGFMTCWFVNRVERPDGTAVETYHCTIDEYFRDTGDGPEPCADCEPDRAVVEMVGSCAWVSDYWLSTTGELLFADSFRVTIAPAGTVSVTAEYAADPPGLAECGFA